MTNWMAFKIIMSMLAVIWLGTMLIALGLQQANLHPYHPSPNMVTPHTYNPPTQQPCPC